MTKDLKPLVLNVRTIGGRHAIPINRKPGAYALIHEKTQSVYIGSSNDLGGRLSAHFTKLKTGLHENRNLQTLYNQDSIFHVKTAITENREEAYDLEEALIKSFGDQNKLLNISTEDVRKASKGILWTEESKRKLSLSQQGKTQSVESNIKRSEALKGKPKPEGFADLLSEINKNHPRRAELNKALSDKRKGGDNPNSKPVTIDGIVYSSGSEASRELNIPRSTLEKRLSSNKLEYKNYIKGISG